MSFVSIFDWQNHVKFSLFDAQGWQITAAVGTSEATSKQQPTNLMLNNDKVLWNLQEREHVWVKNGVNSEASTLSSPSFSKEKSHFLYD